jgi:hypothetical protein
MSAFNVKEPREIPACTIAETAHYLGVPAATLRSWFAGQAYSHKGQRRRFKPVIRPADPGALGLSFSNLVEAYALVAIRRKHHGGLPTIRKGLEYLVYRLGAKRPLLDEQFATLGAQLFVERVREIVNLSKPGQMEMAELIRAYLQRVERDAKRLPIKLYPFMRSQPLRE